MGSPVTNATKRQVVEALVERHGRTYAADARISLGRATPSPLFRLLCLSLLLSARIRAGAAVAACRALSDQGWRTPQRMSESSWSERARVLNQSGYARYDESTARMLGETTDLILGRWHGDLRELREEAERDPAAERRLLKELKGIGDVGVDIFFREVQGCWQELRPFVDDRALDAAIQLGICESPGEVAALVSADDLPVLLAALVRLSLAGDYDQVRAAAAGGGGGG